MNDIETRNDELVYLIKQGLEIDGCKQKDVADIYALCIGRGPSFPYREINRAIIDKWSTSGLTRIKKMAWKIRRGGD